MKKWLFTFMLMLGIVIPGMTNATIRWISESQWKSYDSSYWFSQTCDENVENEIYLWHGWVFLDYFSNPKSNNAPFYIHNYKVMTRGNYVLYNDSIFSPKNEKSMIIFNRDLLASKWWKVKPGEEVRHMTTAEEVNGATFSYNWVMDNPFTASDWKVFSMANFRSDGTHPATPTRFPSWDAEFRIVTLYDADDNLSTTSDNRAIVECQQNVIRRCGDGILDTKYGETCDPKDPTKKNRWNGWCDPTTCQPITVIETPKCASKYNWQTVTNLVEGAYLCEVWTVSEFNYDDNTHTWTWKCKNTAGNSVNCSAKKPYDWTLKIEKTLTTAKQIKEVGETVKWEIVVKAVSGDVKDFTITDTLPDVLDYVDYAIKYNPSNLTVMAPTRDWKKVTWQVTWTLKSWQTLKIELITKANKMPTQEEKNVACVKWTNPVDPNNPDYPNDDCDDDSIKWTKWKLKIEKTLTTAKQIKEVGEEVKWNIKVFAVSGDVTNFTVTDSLPDVLDYVSYKVVSNPANLTLSQPTVNGKNIAWKVTWTLKSWQVLELELVSKANTMPTKEEKNVACVKWENTDPVDPNNPDYPNDDCDDDSIEPKLTPKVWIKKTFDDGSKKKTVKVWEKMTYRITFGNSWNADATITSIKDFLPKNVQYISWSIYLNSNSSHEQFTWGETIDILRWVVSTVEVIDGVHVEKYGGITLKPGDTGYILIEVKVLERKENDSTTNFACIYVNDEKVDCDDAVHDITDSELLCKSNIKDKDSADLCYGSSWTVPVTCESEWGTGDTIAILCDGKETFTGKNISQLTGSCVFSADGDHTVQCKVNGSTKAASGSNCEWVYNLKHHSCGGGGSPSCSSITTSWATTNLDKWNNKVEVTCNTKGGSAYVLIDCDYNEKNDYTKTGNYMVSTGRVTTFSWVCENYTKDSKIQCLVKEYESSSWQSPVTACGTGITIKSWWWRSWGWWGGWWGWGRIDPILLTWSCFNVNGWNASIESWEYLPFYLNVEKLTGHKNNKDSIYVWTGNVKEWDKCSSWWQLALNSMECYYEIMKWDNKQIATWSIPCLTGWDTDKKMVKAWIRWQEETYNGGRPMQSYDPWNGSDVTNTFKSNVKVINNFWNNVKEYWEYKISLTKIDYMFCNENKQWEKDTWSWVCQSNVTLTKPYTVQKTPSGNRSNSTTDLNKFTTINGTGFSTYLPTISTSSYSPNEAVKTAMNKFINKYEKLAVKVNTEKFWKNVAVKKVPWKNIYFLSGNAEFKEGKSDTNPFTIVQTKWSVTIKWDVQHNMMLLTNWNITFSWDCTTTQKVKWIFYAWWSLIRGWVEKNTYLRHDYWCDEWWLQVRWVLIWKNFNDLMNNSRSSLNSWFKEGTNKRKAVMNWASVLIEYSPSIFTKSTMPPGAEDFTTALSVYKN